MIEQELPSLSERELEVLKLVATGATNQQIARDLVISPNTVKVHLRNIFEKLGVQSRTEATLEAVRRGWVCVEGAVIIEGVAVTPPAAEPAAPPEPEPLGPPRQAIARWQRVYMAVAACVVVLSLLAPGWWRSRGEARQTSAFSDQGQPQVAPAVRQANRWTPRAPLPDGRSRLAVVAANGRIYAIAGETAAGASDQVTVYDPVSNGWLPAATKPSAVTNVTAVALGNRIFVPGGTVAGGQNQPQSEAPGAVSLMAGRPFQSPLFVAGAGVTGAVEVYDTVSGQWRAAAPLPAPRAAYGLAALGDRLYLFGGWDGTRYRAETYIYDPQTDAWTAGTAMAAPRGFLAASALGGVIYVAGGYDGRRELDTVAAYDPLAEGSAAGPWSGRAALSQPRAGLGLLTLSKRLYAIGGGWNSGLAYNEQYDIVSSAWSRIESPVIEQWRNLGLAALGEKIYAVGGWSGGYLTINEEYQAIYRVLLPASSSP